MSSNMQAVYSLAECVVNVYKAKYAVHLLEEDPCPSLLTLSSEVKEIYAKADELIDLLMELKETIERDEQEYNPG